MKVYLKAIYNLHLLEFVMLLTEFIVTRASLPQLVLLKFLFCFQERHFRSAIFSVYVWFLPVFSCYFA